MAIYYKYSLNAFEGSNTATLDDLIGVLDQETGYLTHKSSVQELQKSQRSYSSLAYSFTDSFLVLIEKLGLKRPLPSIDMWVLNWDSGACVIEVIDDPDDDLDPFVKLRWLASPWGSSYLQSLKAGEPDKPVPPAIDHNILLAFLKMLNAEQREFLFRELKKYGTID